MTPEQTIALWIREHLGAQVISITRQARWRAAWLVDVERDGIPLPTTWCPAYPSTSSMRPPNRLDTKMTYVLKEIHQVLLRNTILSPEEYDVSVI